MFIHPEWDFENHTILLNQSIIGQLKFKVKGPSKTFTKEKKFARIALPCADEKLELLGRIADLIHNHWRLNPPSMILSFVGGQKDITLDRNIGNAFQNGIINLIKSKSNVWIFSGGTSTGMLHYWECHCNFPHKAIHGRQKSNKYIDFIKTILTFQVFPN
jgi:hypothetical protein